jgi:ABC-2 type transport system ATP-binding protein
MIDLFELEPYRGSYPWSLSGGARRRLQVARELMTDAELLFLDEPTVGLDAMVRRSILGYLHRRARAGTAIVFTTHVLQEADQLCDRIAVLDRGRLVATASPEELKRHYGGARVVELEFEDGAPEADAAALIAELEGLGRDFALLERTGGRFRFRASNPEELVARTSRWGLARGNELRRLSVREATLEEAFVGLISGDGAATNGTDDAGSPGRDPP